MACSKDSSILLYINNIFFFFFYRYSTSLHWSLTQMTPVSGQANAVNSTERFVNILSIIAGPGVIHLGDGDCIENADDGLRRQDGDATEASS